MAGAGYKLFNTGDVLTAQQVNEYLQQQTVMVFADASARTTALSSVLAEGMLSYLKDTNKVYVYDGSAWLDVSSEIPSQTGNAGKYLTTDGTTASWATISSGGMTLISNTVASAASGINLTSIPSTYKQLVLIWSGIDHSTTGSAFGVRFNNSSGATDYYCDQMSYNTNALSTVNSTDTTASGTTTGTRQFFGSSANKGTTGASRGYLVIDNYASTSLFKSYYGSYFYYDNSNIERAGANYFGYFRSTSAISSIDIVRLSGTATLSNQTSTSIRLYGVA